MPASTTTVRSTGRFGTAQLVTIEAALMAVAAAFYALTPVPGAVTVGIVVVVALGVLGRVRGRWLYEAVAARSRLARRRRDARLATRSPAASGPAPRLRLGAFAPGLSVATVADRRGAFGVGRDPLGWFAAVSILPASALARGKTVHMRPSTLAALAADPALPASTLQLVVRHVPLPTATVHPASACATSYRELLQALQIPAPVHSEAWITARLSPRDAAATAADRGGGVTGVHRSLAAALNRVGTALAEAGVGHRVLDGAELHQAVATAYELEPSQMDTGVLEHWSHLRTDRSTHICFAVRQVPAEPPTDLLARLAAVPAALSVTTAVVVGRAQRAGASTDRTTARILVRLTATPAAIDTAVGQLLAVATASGVGLVRLDGEQAAGAYATAPTGGPIGLVPW